MQTITLKCFGYTSISFFFSMLVCLGCQGPVFREACIEFVAVEELAQFEGRTHPVTLYLYPLNHRRGFEKMSVNDLLEGKDPPGMTGDSRRVVINPGERREVEENFPVTTAFVGIVVDYYRAPHKPESGRRVVVEAKCSWMQHSVVLGEQEVILD